MTLSPSTEYRILITDDHPMVRAGVKATLAECDRYRLVGECQDADETLECVARLSPDLLILDVQLGSECSLDWLERFHRAHPTMRILVLSSMSHGEKLRQLQHPAVAGFVLKGEAPHSLLQALRVIETGEGWFSPPIMAELRRLAELEKEGPLFQLSARERQILGLVREAKDNAAIARELQLSKQTVRRRLTVIFQKLGVSNRLGALFPDSVRS